MLSRSRTIQPAGGANRSSACRRLTDVSSSTISSEPRRPRTERVRLPGLALDLVADAAKPNALLHHSVLCHALTYSSRLTRSTLRAERSGRNPESNSKAIGDSDSRLRPPVLFCFRSQSVSRCRNRCRSHYRGARSGDAHCRRGGQPTSPSIPAPHRNSSRWFPAERCAVPSWT